LRQGVKRIPSAAGFIEKEVLSIKDSPYRRRRAGEMIAAVLQQMLRA